MSGTNMKENYPCTSVGEAFFSGFRSSYERCWMRVIVLPQLPATDCSPAHWLVPNQPKYPYLGALKNFADFASSVLAHSGLPIFATHQTWYPWACDQKFPPWSCGASCNIRLSCQRLSDSEFFLDWCCKGRCVAKLRVLQRWCFTEVGDYGLSQ